MGWRKINIDNQIFEYKIGKQNVVITYVINNSIVKKIVSYDDIPGKSVDLVDRGRIKKTTDGMIRPSDIKNYIIENLR